MFSVVLWLFFFSRFLNLSAFLNLSFVNTDTNLVIVFKAFFTPSGRSSESISSWKILIISSATDFTVSTITSVESSFSFPFSFSLFVSANTFSTTLRNLPSDEITSKLSNSRLFSSALASVFSFLVSDICFLLLFLLFV